jgi:hypothetical protein
MKHSEPFIHLLFFILSLFCDSFSNPFRTHFIFILQKTTENIKKLTSPFLSQSPLPRVEVCDHIVEGLPPPQQPRLLLPDALDIFVDILVLNRLRLALRRAPLWFPYIFDFEFSVSVDFELRKHLPRSPVSPPSLDLAAFDPLASFASCARFVLDLLGGIAT